MSSVSVARVLRLASGGCEADHSWAWIDPQGRFYETKSSHVGFSIDKADSNELFDFTLARVRAGEFSYLRKRMPFFVMKEFLRAVCLNPDSSVNPLLQKGYVYQVPERVALLAEAKGFPTLSKGSWQLTERLLPAEERLLETLEVFPEKVLADRDNAWNRKTSRLWAENYTEFLRLVLQESKRYLESQGWVAVANAYNIGDVGRKPSQRQFDSFFSEVLACWKKERLYPPVSREEIWVSGATYSYDDALERFASREVQDSFYEYLLTSPRSTLTQVERYRIIQEREMQELLGDPPADLFPARARPAIPNKERPTPLKPERYPVRPQRRSASAEAVVKLAAVPEKYADIDFRPPKAVADAAKKGLEYRRKASPANRGGLTPAEAGEQGIGSGVQRAVNLSNRDTISPDVIRQMSGFLSRSKKNSAVSPEHRSEPWNDKGHVAWLLWGGDPAEKWVASVIEKMDKADEAAKQKKASRSKTACIIAAGVAGTSRFLLKNRDRNYMPEVKVYHEIRNGVEILYMKDETTGWIEGINEHGVGIVNSALMVGFDEAEKKMVKTVGKKSKDGKVVLEALSQPSLDKALEVVKTYQGGLKGHTFISDAQNGWAVEMTSKHDVVSKRLKPEELYVRTNHGIEYPDAGYTEGDRLVSSVARREKAMEQLKDLDKVEEVAPAIFGYRLKDHSDMNNMVRDTADMRTVSQMVIDLTKKRVVLYIIPGKSRYLGMVEDLPDDYKPKLKFDLYKYTDIDGDGEFDVIKKKPKKKELPPPEAEDLEKEGEEPPVKKASASRVCSLSKG